MRKLPDDVKRANRAKWVAENTERLKRLGKDWRTKNKDRIREVKNAEARKAKQDGIKAYGGVCQCCGEWREEFLTIEHTEGRGAACYAEIEPNGVRYTGMRLWLQLKRKKWPRVGYALLCFNCNCAKGAFGYCPHELERQKANEGIQGTGAAGHR